MSLHKKKKCQVTRRKELFYYVASGSNVVRDVHWCVTVDYQQIGNGNIVNQIHGFTIDYGKFILILLRYFFKCKAWLSRYRHSWKLSQYYCNSIYTITIKSQYACDVLQFTIAIIKMSSIVTPRVERGEHFKTEHTEHTLTHVQWCALYHQ